MGFDPISLAKRAVTLGSIKPTDIISAIAIPNPWDFFSHNIKADDDRFEEISILQAPFNSNKLGIKVRWQKDVDDDAKIPLFKKYLDQLATYEAKSSLCKRPEECDQKWLSSHIWESVNLHFSSFSINANNINSLVEQLGILRFGRKPKVGDVFSGGGSIPLRHQELVVMPLRVI